MTILVLWLAGFPPGVGELIAYCLYCVCYVIVRSAVSISIEEIELAGDGLVLSLDLVRKRVRIAVFMGGAALVIALLYAGNRSLLPYGILAQFFTWLGSLFSQKAAPALQIRQPATLAPPMPDIRGLFTDMPSAKPWPWLDTLWQVLRIGALAAGVAAVLVFIFGPLFSRDFRSFLRRVNPLAAVVNGLLRSLRAGGRRLRAMVRAAKRLFGGLSAAEAADFADLTKPPPRSVFRPTRRKRLEVDRVRREFLRVVKWGEDAGIHYADCLTASEYAGRVAVVRDESAGELSRFAGIFDEAIYSPNEIGIPKLRLLHKLVDILVRSR